MGQIKLLDRFMQDKKIIVLDHHKPGKKTKGRNIVHVNPHFFDINGSADISGAGVAYYFAAALNKKNRELAHLSVIGAIGDNQEKDGFSGLNSKILEIAVKEFETIEVTRGLRMFGRQSKPLHRLLEYTFDPYIPGVTGSSSGALRFLRSLGINPRVGKDWKKLVHLTDDELKKLADGIIKKRVNEKDPEDVFGPVYTLVNEPDGPLRDAREFSTLLNACGRLGKASLGISACLGDRRMKDRAIGILVDYRMEIINALRWYHENRGTPSVIETEGYTIINAKHNILSTMIGTIASILSNSNEIRKGTIVVTIGRSSNKKSKVSLRIAGSAAGGTDLRKIITDIVRNFGGEAGGHRNAAGALIDTSKEKAFIEQARIMLDRHSIAETI